MAVRFHAQRRQFPLERVEVGVSFRHGAKGERDSFERTLLLEGDLDARQRSFLQEAASLCPVGALLGIAADIHTHLDAATSAHGPTNRASYEDDLALLSIPNVTPD
jgi:putative redox protein